MSADDARKDELAARALSRLSEPPIPEGLAARIAARAAATPQIGAERPAEAPTAPSAPLPGHVPMAPRVARNWRRSQDRRHHLIAASIAAALLVSAGVYAGLRDRTDETAPLARDEPTQALPQADTPAPSRLADAAPPAKAVDAKPLHREKARPASPTMTSPVPTAPPVELVAEDAPSTTTAPKEPPAEESRLAQTGPKDAPNVGLRPVYGPPAPVGLGIAGGTGGASLPGEATGASPRGSGSGNAPTSGPPPGMPGPGGGPRGPGPRM